LRHENSGAEADACSAVRTWQDALVLRLGLTGGIGAGKSTVARRLVEHGAVLVDADRLAREVVEPGTEGLAAVAAAFGPGVLAADGALDRPALGSLVFADEAARRRLNQILHPRIAALTAERFAAAPSDAVVVHDVPLLVENRMGADYHLVIVVHAPVEERVRRLVADRGMAEPDARARIASQADDAARRAAADAWLENTGDVADVVARVDGLWTGRIMPFEENLRARRGAEPAPPGCLVRADPEWPAQAARLAGRVARAVGAQVADVAHTGATAAPGTAARDVVELELVVRDAARAHLLADRLAVAGFFPAGCGVAAVDGWPLFESADPGRPATVRVRCLAEGGPAPGVE
jgi:dephospho-CoA kinase